MHLHDLALCLLPPLQVRFDLRQDIDAIRDRLVPWLAEHMRKEQARVMPWQTRTASGGERRGATKKRRPATMVLQPWQRRRKRR